MSEIRDKKTKKREHKVLQLVPGLENPGVCHVVRGRYDSTACKCDEEQHVNLRKEMMMIMTMMVVMMMFLVVMLKMIIFDWW